MLSEGGMNVSKHDVKHTESSSLDVPGVLVVEKLALYASNISMLYISLRSPNMTVFNERK